MEEKSTALVKSTPAYIQKSLETLESSMEYAKVLVNTKLVPNHFYEKGSDGKPDYTKGKPEAVLLVIQHGMELGLSVSQSLQQIVPTNGKMSIQGDGAKALIMGSGKCKFWNEEYSGSVENGDYEVKITSEKITGEKMVSIFNLQMAKRAGLYYEPNKIPEKISYSYKFSPWFKYTERMIRYRALGFIARDLYPEVLNGTVTLEEAQDYPKETEVEIVTQTGNKIKTTESKQLHLNEKQKDISDKIAEKLSGIQDVHEITEETAPEEITYSEKELTDMGTGIYDFAKTFFSPQKYKILSSLPGKKSTKKYVDVILAYQSDGDLGFSNFVKDHALNETKAPENSKSENELTLNTEFSKENEFEIDELESNGVRSFTNVMNLYQVGVKKKITDKYIIDNYPFKGLEEFLTKSPKVDIEELFKKF